MKTITAAIASLIALLPQPLLAQISWTGNTSANWNTASNWSPSGVPGSTGQILFPGLAKNKTINFNSLSAHETLIFSGDSYTLTSSTNTLTLGGARTLSSTSAGGLAIIDVAINAPSGGNPLFAASNDATLRTTRAIALNNNLLTVNPAANSTVDLRSAVSGTASTALRMIGAGELTIRNVNHTASGLYQLEQGSTTLILRTINGSIRLDSAARFSAVGGRTNGDATLTGDVVISSSSAFNVGGNLAFSGTPGSGSGKNLDFFVRGPLTSSYSQMRVEGGVTTGRHRVNLDIRGGYEPGTEFVFIRKDSAGAISSASNPFRNPNDTTISTGTQFNHGAHRFQFSYSGGDGNDFSASVVPAPFINTIRDWTGNTNDGFATDTNWSSNVLPGAGMIMRFGQTGTSQKNLINDLGGNYGGIHFAGTGGFTINPSNSSTTPQLLLLSGGISAGIRASHSTAPCTLSSPIMLLGDQTWSHTGSAALDIAADGTLDLGTHALTLNSAPSSGSPLFNLDSPISGSGSVFKHGAGTVVFGGASPNTYSGTTTVSDGVLRLAKPTGPAIPGNLTIGGGANPASLTTTTPNNFATTSVVTVANNGTLDHGSAQTIGGLNLTGGNVDGGLNILTVAGNLSATEDATISSPVQMSGSIRTWQVDANKTLTLSGNLTITPANTAVTQAKTGTGELRITSTSANTTFRLDAGNLRVDTTSTSTVSVQLNGGRLTGNGRIRNLTTTAFGGTVEPGVGTGTSVMRTTGIALGGNAAIELNIHGTTPGTDFDQLICSGAVDLGGASLLFVDTAVLPLGSVLTILDKTSVGAITGTFASRPENSIITGEFNQFRISYIGGNGNDVTLTVVAVDSGLTRVWTGGAAGSPKSWSDNSNWTGGVVPRPGDTIEFPVNTLAPGTGSQNDLALGMAFYRIRFTGSTSNINDLGISGNPLTLGAGIESTATETAIHTTRQLVIAMPVTFASGATVANISTTNPRRIAFTATSTTLGALEFVGRNGALPQGLVQFPTGEGITGAGPVIVRDNASVALSPNAASNWSGNTQVIHGRLTSLPHTLLPNGLTIGNGVSPAEVNVLFLGGMPDTAAALTVTNNATLSANSLRISSLTVNDGGTISQISNQLVCDALTVQAGGGFNAATAQITVSGTTSAAGPMTAASLETDDLIIQNTSVSLSGAAAVANGLMFGGTSSFSCGSLESPLLHVAGSASFAASGDVALGNDMVLTTSATTTIGGRLTFQANAFLSLAGNRLEVGGLGGVDGDSPVSIFKSGGTIVVANDFEHMTLFQLTNGTAQIDASNGSAVPVEVVVGTLSGNGVVGPVLLRSNSGATLAPGASPGRLTMESLVAGSLAGPAPTIQWEIGGTVAGLTHDQVRSNGPVNLSPFGSGTRLFIDFLDDFVPTTGTTFVLLDQTGPSPIDGTFRLEDSGTEITEAFEQDFTSGASTIRLAFSYQGGDGNDFTATVIDSPIGGYRVWTGDGADAQWSTAGNWLGDIPPQPGENVRFPAGAAQTTNQNDLPADQSLGEIRIETAYTFTGNRVLADGGIVAEFPTGTATIGFPLLFEAGSNALIESNGGGKLLIDSVVTLGQDAALVLRRVDPTFIFGTAPIEIGSILAKLSTAGHSVTTEGGGRVRFLNASRNYQGTTFVRHGRLQTLTSGNLLPGDLTIGGGPGPAIYENPGTTISITRTLRLEPGGTHTFIGAGASDNVSEIDFAGGNTDGTGTFNIRDRWTTRSGFGYTASGTNSFITSSGLATKIIDVEDGASHTILAGASITGSNPGTFNLRKEGGGSLRVAGNFFGNQITLTEGSLGPLAGGAVNPEIILGGGILRGVGTVNGEITANSNGGAVSPGGFTVADSLGILSITSNYLPNEDTTLRIEIGGTTPGSGHDQLRQSNIFNTTLTIDLADSSLDVRLVNGFVPTPGDTFRIIDKVSTPPVVRTFAAKPEGGSFVSDGYQWSITYTGGDGNDVVLTALGPAAAIVVEQPAASPIANGGTAAFGSVPVDDDADIVFTIRNTGTPGFLDLNGSPAVALTGPDAAEFEVTVQPDTSIAPGGSTTFTVRFAPLSAGAKSATLTIDNTDPVERPFVIQLTGTGLGATPPAPPALADISIIPATPTTPGKFSAVISGPPNAFMELEVSEDLGNNDPWQVIHTFQLDATGQAVLADIEFMGTTSATSAFFRARQL